MTENAYFTTLNNRGLIQIEGADRHEFLQSLVTNDVTKTTPSAAIYACLLNPQGKFLHDFFISEIEDVLFLECEGGDRADDLFKRLSMYCLRADAQISLDNNIPVYAIFGAPAATGYPDPRHKDMGWRSFDKPSTLPEKPFEIWDRRRIALCIPDGSRDLIPATSTMDEARMDTIGAIDYDKGCYIGQELTARMHYRGLGKKHLYAVEGELPESGADILSDDGKVIGQMRSVCGDVGLALLKDSELKKLHLSAIIS